MTQISLSDLEANPGKYVTMAQEQDATIPRNGKVAAKIVSAKPDKKAAWAQISEIFRTSALQMTDNEINRAKEERILG